MFACVSFLPVDVHPTIDRRGEKEWWTIVEILLLEVLRHLLADLDITCLLMG
jgi:hypothetical protein